MFAADSISEVRHPTDQVIPFPGIHSSVRAVLDMKFVAKTYTNACVELDNNEFVDCRFGPGCIVTFAGNGPAKVIGCQFDGATMMFEGSAQVTFSFLRTIAQSPGGAQLVRAILEHLVFQPPDR